MFKIRTLLKTIKKIFMADSIFLFSIAKHFYYLLFYNIQIIPHYKTSIKGIKNIKNSGVLEVGLSYVGFMLKSDKTFLNIRGSLQIADNYSIGRGCRVDIGPEGLVQIGRGGYINCNTFIIIMHKLMIGNNTIISWNCHILDEDFHSIEYEGKRIRPSEIIIGDNVWIGCNVKIYKGVTIADGCVVSADSVVKTPFMTPNCLISGNPARIIKENVYWN